MIQALIVTLILKTPTQFVCMAHWLRMMHQHTRCGYKRLRSSEDILWRKPCHCDSNIPPNCDSNIAPTSFHGYHQPRSHTIAAYFKTLKTRVTLQGQLRSSQHSFT